MIFRYLEDEQVSTVLPLPKFDGPDSPFHDFFPPTLFAEGGSFVVRLLRFSVSVESHRKATVEAKNS